MRRRVGIAWNYFTEVMTPRAPALVASASSAVIYLIQGIGPVDQLTQFQASLLKPVSQTHDVFGRPAGSVGRSNEPFFLHDERKHLNAAHRVDS